VGILERIDNPEDLVLGKFFTRFLILVAIVLAAAGYQFNQVSKVQDPELVRQAKEVLTDSFRSMTLEEVAQSVHSMGSLKIIADKAGSLVTQDVTLLAVKAGRTILPWKESKDVVLQVDFILEEKGAKVASGRRYLRFEPTVDQRWRYLGETDFEGFFRNLF
jgi:hypothetical protein